MADAAAEHRVELKTQELRVLVGDNAAGDPQTDPLLRESLEPGLQPGVQPGVAHRGGYNGLWALRSVQRPQNLFLPFAGGMNLEFIMDGHTGTPTGQRRLIFEPRDAPMVLEASWPGGARLHQPPTPFWGVQSWTEFRVAEPHCIDVSFECLLTRASWHYDWLCLFWANYIFQTTPEESWIHIVDPAGEVVNLGDSEDGSVVREGDRVELAATEGWRERPLSSGRVRFGPPYFFGRREGMMFQLMFDTPHRLGFWSGSWKPPETWESAAWDAHMTILDPRVGQRYGMAARLVYAPWQGPELARREYERWREQRRAAQ